MKKNSFLIRGIAAIAAVTPLLAACGGGDSPSTTEPDDSTQIANPASVFCVEQGGTLEIVDEADGQVGYCTLPDGTRIEEWEYYRSQNPDATESGTETPDTVTPETAPVESAAPESDPTGSEVIESELPGDGVD